MLFAAKKMARSGQQIQQILEDADQNPEKRSQIQASLAKHFGTREKPNPDLLPNVPAAEKGSIMRLLRQEIMTQGQSDGLGGASFDDLHSYQIGAGKKANYDRSISSGKQEMYRNIARAYSSTIKDVLPEIKKPYADFSAAKKAVDSHAQGLGELLQGGGALGWFLRAKFVYPAISSMVNGSNGGVAPAQIDPNSTSNVGFKGY